MTFLEACWHWLAEFNNWIPLAFGAFVAAIWRRVHLRISSGGINNLAKLIDSVEQKKAQLDRLRPLSASALAQLQKLYDVDLAYEFRIWAGPNMTDYADDIGHGLAQRLVRKLAATTTPVDEQVVRKLNRRLNRCYQPKFHGVYRRDPTWIKNSPVVFPNPAEIPQLMEEFGAWLRTAPYDPASAFEAHYRLVSIHPFYDGNGHTGRLLMNLLLMRGGYPPVKVRRENHKVYCDSLKRASLTGDLGPYLIFMHQRLDATLGKYLTALQEALSRPEATAPKTGPKL